MLTKLRQTQRCVKRNLASSANDPAYEAGVVLRMAKLSKIHEGKTPPRIHFIVEWAEKRSLSQADIVREIGADKSVVSRWFSGSLPSEKYLEPLAALFSTEVTGLFRHPDDDWMVRFLQERSLDELTRIKQTLEAAFPRNEKDKKAS
ncbi:XRE family transcriptional regulator [Devosia sp. D6-9]|nr:XRE family transcriptional regulator [Devosia sp. D6-9]